MRGKTKPRPEAKAVVPVYHNKACKPTLPVLAISPMPMIPITKLVNTSGKIIIFNADIYMEATTLNAVFAHSGIIIPTITPAIKPMKIPSVILYPFFFITLLQ